MLFPSWVHWQQATVLFPCCQSRIFPHYVTPTHTIKQNNDQTVEKKIYSGWDEIAKAAVTWVHLKASNNTMAQQRTQSIKSYFEIFSFYLLTYLLTYLSHQDLKLIFTIFLQREKKVKINGKIAITVGVQFTGVLRTSAPTGWRRLGAFQPSAAFLMFLIEKLIAQCRMLQLNQHQTSYGVLSQSSLTDIHLRATNKVIKRTWNIFTWKKTGWQ